MFYTLKCRIKCRQFLARYTRTHYTHLYLSFRLKTQFTACMTNYLNINANCLNVTMANCVLDVERSWEAREAEVRTDGRASDCRDQLANTTPCTRDCSSVIYTRSHNSNSNHPLPMLEHSKRASTCS